MVRGKRPHCMKILCTIYLHGGERLQMSFSSNLFGYWNFLCQVVMQSTLRVESWLYSLLPAYVIWAKLLKNPVPVSSLKWDYNCIHLKVFLC